MRAYVSEDTPGKKEHNSGGRLSRTSIGAARWHGACGRRMGGVHAVHAKSISPCLLTFTSWRKGSLMKLALVTIVTANLEQMRTFYQAVLQIEPQIYRGNYAAFTLKTGTLALWRQSAVYLHPADKYHRLTRPTVIRVKRPSPAGSHGLPAALSPLVTPSRPAVWTHVVRSGHLPVPLPTSCVLTLPRAAATAAPERATPPGGSTPDPSAQRPSLVSAATIAWLSPSRWSAGAVAMARVG